ncbi:hypothetical protein Pcinc_039086 [Petrolisthes cinctipes]|uniref:Uncharacterized protein n=1 Tax=Petrolisthes cinctipes TaxID=88211 RepID=A0AAE1BT33_PETCI|nr:hypothetical protein Pcinc_039086 [Petrolisthes cinctipes]
MVNPITKISNNTCGEGVTRCGVRREGIVLICPAVCRAVGKCGIAWEVSQQLRLVHRNVYLNVIPYSTVFCSVPLNNFEYQCVDLCDPSASDIDVCVVVYVEMCVVVYVEMCMEVYVEMCMVVCVEMCVVVYVEMCVVVYVEMCVVVYVEMCMEVCVEMCMEVCVEMCVAWRGVALRRVGHV